MITGTSAMDRPVERPRGTSRRARLVIGGAALLVLMIALAIPALARWARADRAVESSRLRLATVTRGDLERDINAQGRIVAALHPTLFAPAPGTAYLEVKAGTEVKKGQLMARIDSPELKSRLVQEKATLASVQADFGRQEIAARQARLRSRQNVDVLTVRLAAAERAAERAKALFDEGLLNKTDHEKSRDDVEVTRLELKNAQETARLEIDSLDLELRNRRVLLERQTESMRELQRQVDQLQMTAPFDGMVATVSVQDRDAVAANAPVLMVVNLSSFEVEFDLPENYASDVVAGTPAEILYEGKTYRGRVTAISPEVRESQVKGTLAFAGETPAGLRQSQRVTTRLLLERRPNVLKVPRGPFLEAGGGRQAYVVDGGMAVQRAIEVGATSVGEVEIRTGLREGERIVVSDTSLFEGARTVLVRN